MKRRLTSAEIHAALADPEGFLAALLGDHAPRPDSSRRDQVRAAAAEAESLMTAASLDLVDAGVEPRLDVYRRTGSNAAVGAALAMLVTLRSEACEHVKADTKAGTARPWIAHPAFDFVGCGECITDMLATVDSAAYEASTDCDLCGDEADGRIATTHLQVGHLVIVGGLCDVCVSLLNGPGARPVGTIVRVPKVGRNEPCPCGSGRKFKKCHGGGGAR